MTETVGQVPTFLSPLPLSTGHTLCTGCLSLARSPEYPDTVWEPTGARPVATTITACMYMYRHPRRAIATHGRRRSPACNCNCKFTNMP